ncbi:MAG: hypothetical protein ACC662_06720 [Planctomycetota bacterium]
MQWTPVTTTGFGEPDDFGVRALLPTPWGLLVGATNTVTGFELWLGRR